MVCLSKADNSTVTVLTQIMNKIGAPAAGPGYLVHSTILRSDKAHPLGAQTFNLASTRALTVSSTAVVTAYFGLKVLAMNQVTTCKYYDAAFTMLFVPDP